MNGSVNSSTIDTSTNSSTANTGAMDNSANGGTVNSQGTRDVGTNLELHRVNMCKYIGKLEFQHTLSSEQCN